MSFRCLQKALTLLIKGSRDLLPRITMQRVLVVGVSLLVWDSPHKIPSRLSLKMCQVFHRRCSHQIVLKMIESVTHSCNTIELSFIFVLNSNDFDSIQQWKMGPIHIELNIFGQKWSHCVSKGDEIRLPCSTLWRYTDLVGKIELNIRLVDF